MTSLQILALAMPFMVLVLVLVVMALTKWQDKREDERNRAKLG